MGMYTELVLKTEIKKNAPDQVHDILNFLFNGKDEPAEKPDHAFFKFSQWKQIGSGCSYFHVPFPLSKYDEGYIFSRSDLKNYDGEIQSFIEWLKPYIDGIEGVCIGWLWYEEEDAPTLLFV